MDSPSIVVGGLVSVAESLDRRRFRIGEPSLTSETRSNKDSTEHVPVSRRPASIAPPIHEQPGGTVPCTLRVKPDRRRTQVSVPPGTDRRRT